MSDKPVSKPTEIVDDPDDPELSELLDSALADFGRPVPTAPAAAAAPAAPAPPTVSAASAAAAAGQAAGDAGPAQQEGIKDAYKAFEEAMKQALQVRIGQVDCQRWKIARLVMCPEVGLMSEWLFGMFISGSCRKVNCLSHGSISGDFHTVLARAPYECVS